VGSSFRTNFANDIRRRSAGRLGDKWHLDEVVIAIAGKKHWLWRAVDQDGFVLDVLVQSRRNAKAAKRLMRKLMKGQGHSPRVMITDKLRSYGAAKRDIMPGVEHRSHKRLNNRAKNSHQPTRRRERIMKGFKSARHLQRFVSIHDPVANLFHIPRNEISSDHHYFEKRSTDQRILPSFSLWKSRGSSEAPTALAQNSSLAPVASSIRQLFMHFTSWWKPRPRVSL
jgi:putative transposase